MQLVWQEGRSRGEAGQFRGRIVVGVCICAYPFTDLEGKFLLQVPSSFHGLMASG